MRHSPTVAGLAWIATVVGLALIGCAPASDDAAGDQGEVAPETPSEDAKEVKPAPPKFETSGSESAPAPRQDQDPAPPESDQCIDKDDPGGSENVAHALPEISDCDNSYRSVAGTMKGAVDVDFFKLSAKDESFCSLDTDFQAATAGTELCVFMRCKNSTVDAVTGCDQGTLATSEIGMKGCCAAAPGSAVPTWDCSGFTDDDSADVFMRVRPLNNADQCLQYTVKYRF